MSYVISTVPVSMPVSIHWIAECALERTPRAIRGGGRGENDGVETYRQLCKVG